MKANKSKKQPHHSNLASRKYGYRPYGKGRVMAVVLDDADNVLLASDPQKTRGAAMTDLSQTLWDMARDTGDEANESDD